MCVPSKLNVKHSEVSQYRVLGSESLPWGFWGTNELLCMRSEHQNASPLKRPPHRTSELWGKEDGKPRTSGVQSMRPWLESCPSEAWGGWVGRSIRPDYSLPTWWQDSRTHDFFPLPPYPFCLPDSQHDLLKQATRRH